MTFRWLVICLGHVWIYPKFVKNQKTQASGNKDSTDLSIFKKPLLLKCSFQFFQFCLNYFSLDGALIPRNVHSEDIASKFLFSGEWWFPVLSNIVHKWYKSGLINVRTRYPVCQFVSMFMWRYMQHTQTCIGKIPWSCKTLHYDYEKIFWAMSGASLWNPNWQSCALPVP